MKKKWIFLAVIALLTLAAAFAFLSGRRAAVPYGENVLVNGDFEQVDDRGRFVAWGQDAYLKTPGISAYEAVTLEGDTWAQIKNQAANDARLAQTVSVHPGTLYALEGEVLAQAEGGRGANLSVENVYAFSQSVFEGKEKTTVRLYGMTGSNQTRLTVFVRLGGYSGESAGVAQFNNVKLYAVREVPPTYATHDFAPQQKKAVETEEEGKSGQGPLLAAVGLAALALLIAAAQVVSQRPLPQNPMVLSLALVALAFLARVPVALLVDGYGVDIGCFTAWANHIANVGPARFYLSDLFVDYPPLYMLMLWPLGLLGRLLTHGATEFMVKLPPILADAATVYLILRFAQKHTGDRRKAALFALLYALNPLALLVGAGWGQVDALTAVTLALSALAIIKGQWKAALPVFVLSVLAKPQALMFGPMGVVALVMAIVLAKDKKALLLDVLRGVGLSLLCAALVVLPFQKDQAGFAWLIKLYQGTMGYYNRATVNMPNLFFLFGLNWVPLSEKAPLLLKSLAALAFALPVAAYSIRQNKLMWQYAVPAALTLVMVPLPLSIQWAGIAYMVCVFWFAAFGFWRTRRQQTLFLAAAFMLTGFVVFGSMMHERYLFPAVLLLLLALVLTPDRRILALLSSATLLSFVSVGLVLERAGRIGGAEGHLYAPSYGILSETMGLELALALLFVAQAALFLYWYLMLTSPGAVLLPLRRVTLPKRLTRPKETAATAPAALKAPEPVRMGRREKALVLLATLVYTAFAFFNLGATKAPQKPWVADGIGEAAVLKLDAPRAFQLLYYPGIHWGGAAFQIQTADTEAGLDQAAVHRVDVKEGECFQWRYVQDGQTQPVFHGQYVRVTGLNIGLTLMELQARDLDTGLQAPLTAVDENGAALADEQDSMQREGLYFASARNTQPAPLPNWYNGMYFDEIYHARTAYEQLNALRGQEPSAIYETTHPPLGKVLMTLSVAVFGMTPFGWRFAGTLAGALMLPGIYYLARQLFQKQRWAWFALAFFAFDTMHFTQTRIATIDSFVTLFIVWAFAFMVQFFMMDAETRPLRHSLAPLFLSGLMMGLSIASKWTGCYAGVGLAVIFFFKLALLYQQQEREGAGNRSFAARHRRLLQYVLWAVLFFVVIPALIYYLSFYPVYAADYDGLTVQKVLNMNRHMLSYHAEPGRGMDHPYYSPWYLWPISQKPMYYAKTERLGTTGSTIFAFGNPVVWLMGLVSVLGTAALFLMKKRGEEDRLRAHLPALLLAGFSAQYLPWIFVPRGTYIYHYFPSVPFMILCTVYMVRALGRRWPKMQKPLYIGLLVLAGAAFILLYPYAGGLRVPRAWLDFANIIPGLYY